MDAFTCDWAEDNNWWFSQYSGLLDMLKTGHPDSSPVVTLPYLALLFPDGADPADFVV